MTIMMVFIIIKFFFFLLLLLLLLLLLVSSSFCFTDWCVFIFTYLDTSISLQAVQIFFYLLDLSEEASLEFVITSVCSILFYDLNQIKCAKVPQR